MEILIRFYRMCNLLSLDVAAGAVICALYFSKLLSVPPKIQGMLALGFVVWVIYTVDRLLDVRAMSNPAASERHQFHQRYQKLLWTLSFLAALAAISIVPFLRTPVLIGGIFISLLAGLYLLVQKQLKAKEVFVAAIYTSGVLLTSFSVTSEVSYIECLLITQLFIVALINLLLFSWFEYDTDKQDGHSSFAIQVGKKTTGKCLFGLGTINFLITLWIGTQTSWQAPFLFLLMTVVLIFIFFFHTFFLVNARYRLVGDAVFFMPAIGLFL
ncbi:MAG: hypothetical protein JNM78_14435 [Cyclobacteriaceae bacterium]|nr:hypothetical protein [Cyclobacteriaceae bacterium]